MALVPDRTSLKKFIADRFSREELAIFCNDYYREVYSGYENSNITLQKWALELVEYCERHGITNTLAGNLAKARPVPWLKTFPNADPESIKRNSKQVFISYSTKDERFAEQLANDLRQWNVPVWIAPDSLHPGEDFVKAIDRGLKESGIFLALLTPNAIDSEWFKEETLTALRFRREGKMKIIPLDVVACDWDKVSSFLKNLQGIDFKQNYEAAFSELAHAIGIDYFLLAERFEVAQREITSLQTKINQLEQKQVSNLRTEALFTEQSRLEQELAHAKKAFERLQSELVQEKSDSEQIKKQLDLAKNKLDTVAKQYSDLNIQHQAAKDLKKADEQTIKNLTADKDRLQKGLQLAENQVGAISKERDKLKNELAKAESALKVSEDAKYHADAQIKALADKLALEQVAHSQTKEAFRKANEDLRRQKASNPRWLMIIVPIIGLAMMWLLSSVMNNGPSQAKLQPTTISVASPTQAVPMPSTSPSVPTVAPTTPPTLVAISTKTQPTATLSHTATPQNMPTPLPPTATSTVTPRPTNTATPIPTARPTATPFVPTATPFVPTATSAPSFDIPVLREPASGASFGSNDKPTFSWTSAGNLGSLDYYQFSIQHAQGWDVICTKSTSAQARDYVPTLSGGQALRWNVAVVRLSSAISDRSACSGITLIATSETRSLNWSSSVSSDRENPKVAPTAAACVPEPGKRC